MGSLSGVERNLVLRNCVSAASVEDATTLNVERGASLRLSLASGDEEEFDVYESDRPDGGVWKRSLDEDEVPVSITLTNDTVRPLPVSLLGCGWVRFVGAVRTIEAKVLG